eukprot:38458_1
MGSCTSAARNYHDENYVTYTKSTTSHDDDMVTIKIKMMKAEPFHITISAYASVDRLKRKLESITHIEPHLQRLICRGEGILKSNKTINDYSITHGSIIVLSHCIIPLYHPTALSPHLTPVEPSFTIPNTQWTPIGYLPKHSKTSFICILNNHTDIISVCDDGIYKYNLKIQGPNPWTLYKPFPMQLSINSMCLDPDSQSNDLYMNILDSYIHSKFYKCEQHKDTMRMTSIDIHGCNDEFIENSIIIDGEYHIFALDEIGNNLQHLILNKDTNTFHKIHDFQTALGNFDLVYCPKKKRLFLLGGLIPFCIGQDLLTDIYSLSLAEEDKQWHKLCDVQLPVALADPVCVLTNDEQYMIILGGSA